MIKTLKYTLKTPELDMDILKDIHVTGLSIKQPFLLLLLAAWKQNRS